MTQNSSQLQKMMGWVFGYQISKAIYVACELKIADALGEESLSVEALANQLKCHMHSLSRLLKALTTIGIFHEESPNVFAQTELSRLLSASSPNSIQAAVLLYGGIQYKAWGDLTYSVMTGETAFSHQNKTDFFSYLGEDQELSDIFQRCLNSNAIERSQNVLSCYDFSDIKTIIDVGGGDGAWLDCLLDKYNDLSGIVFDTENTINNCHQRGLPLKTKYKDRIQFVHGDFFVSVPSGGDLYFLSHILHDWNDEKAGIILDNCRRSINKEGQLLLVERMLLPVNQPDYGKWMDLNMLVMMHGQERTKEQYEDLLLASGFKLTRTISTSVGLDLIEAEPV